MLFAEGKKGLDGRANGAGRERDEQTFPRLRRRREGFPFREERL